MPYRCKACDWLDERDKPKQCHRCHSTAVIKLSDERFFDLSEQGEVTWCNACKRMHLSNQRVGAL